MAKGWTEERRRAQAERCRANKPWDKSTGPKTEAGKARVSMNAYKYGSDTRCKKLMRDILKHNRAFVKSVWEFETIKLIKTLEKQHYRGGRYPKTKKSN